MAVLIDALRPRMLPGLTNVSGPAIDGLSVGLATGAYIPTAGTSTLRFDFRDAATVAAFYAADAARLASASIETMLATENGMRSNAPVSWWLIQLYYAAYYAGHAVLRIVGCSCTYLSPAAAGRIARVLNTLGIASPFVLSGGLYACDASGSANLMVGPLGGGPTGGTHELFWRRFIKEIDTLTSAILVGPLPAADAQLAAARLIDVRDTLSTGTGDWLSKMRNEVQYRQGLGVWFPARLDVRHREQLKALIKSWTAPELKHTYPRGSTAGELFEFASACVFVAGICRALILDIADRAPRRGRSFVDHGPAKLLRQHDRD